MTNEKELRKEWRDEGIFEFHITSDETLRDIADEIADWWLSKLHFHTKEVIERAIKEFRDRPGVTIEKPGEVRINPNTYEPQYQYFEKEQIYHILASLEDNKK